MRDEYADELRRYNEWMDAMVLFCPMVEKPLMQPEGTEVTFKSPSEGEWVDAVAYFKAHPGALLQGKLGKF